MQKQSMKHQIRVSLRDVRKRSHGFGKNFAVVGGVFGLLPPLCCCCSIAVALVVVLACFIHPLPCIRLAGLFGVSDCVIEKMRGKHDCWNGTLSGFVTGGMLAIRSGPSGAFLGQQASGCSPMRSIR